MDKREIIESRLNGFGSSDAKMIASVGRSGKLNSTAKKRIAEMLGLKEKQEFFSIPTKKGNEIEQAIYESFLQFKPQAVSNPRFTSVNFDAYQFAIINHIDIEIEEKEKITWIEVKATIDSYQDTYNKYIDQLAWHQMLLEEKAQKFGKKHMLMICHYDTSDGSVDFDPNKITMRPVNVSDLIWTQESIIKGIDIIAKCIDDGFVYEAEKSETAENLPAETQNMLTAIDNLLRIAADAEKRANEFKIRLKAEMQKNGIKKIDNDMFSVTYVEPTTRSTFDSSSLKKSEPDTYSKYLKTSNMGASIRIVLK